MISVSVSGFDSTLKNPVKTSTNEASPNRSFFTRTMPATKTIQQVPTDLFDFDMATKGETSKSEDQLIKNL